MGLALNTFGWSADQFWNATAHEFWAMIEARKTANEEAEQRTRG